ncbi:MAG: family 1 extracellular solute-binding protein, partial [Paenibacillaceae bacterium]|nr:family 1 extracellular solute-binding protein [Paenibacillaceae bacterium]
MGGFGTVANKTGLQAIVLIFLIIVVAGCGNAANESAENGETAAAVSPSAAKAEPVTLTFFPQTGITQTQFQNFFIDPVKKKYPNITLQLLQKTDTIKSPEDLLSAGYPDIVLAGYGYTANIEQMKVGLDLTPYMKKYKIDENQFVEEAVHTIKSYSPNKVMYGLPYAINYAVTFYNKDIFDKFGVSYPTDGMTWDDAVNLARKVNRADGGIQYRGIDPGNPRFVEASVGLGYVDPKTNKAAVNTDGWKRIMNLLSSIYSLPNFVDGQKYDFGTNAFVKDRTLAMYPAWSDILGSLEDLENSGNPLNWDMATMPDFPDQMGMGRNAGAHTLYVANVSKHKEEAFEVLSVVTSPEVQAIVNRSGRLSSLKPTDQIKKEYGMDLKTMKGKHKEAIFKMTPTPLKPTLYDNYVFPVLN